MAHVCGSHFVTRVIATTINQIEAAELYVLVATSMPIEPQAMLFNFGGIHDIRVL